MSKITVVELNDCILLIEDKILLTNKKKSGIKPAIVW